MLNVVNACSHIQNASLARLALTSVPNTKYNLKLMLAFRRAGVVAAVGVGGRLPPDPQAMRETPENYSLYRDVKNRRLWFELKYWCDQPVIRQCTAISTSSKPRTAKLFDLRGLAVGRRSNGIEGLAIGELLFIGTDSGILELREAIANNRGGHLLCLVST